MAYLTTKPNSYLTTKSHFHLTIQSYFHLTTRPHYRLTTKQPPDHHTKSHSHLTTKSHTHRRHVMKQTEPSTDCSDKQRVAAGDRDRPETGCNESEPCSVLLTAQTNSASLLGTETGPRQAVTSPMMANTDTRNHALTSSWL